MNYVNEEIKDSILETSKKFPNLTDKCMITKFEHYDKLCIRFLNLKNRKINFQNPNNVIERNIINTLNIAEKIHNQLKYEIVRICGVYLRGNYRNFISQTAYFKVLLKDLRRYIQDLEFLFSEFQKTIIMNTENQKTK